MWWLQQQNQFNYLLLKVKGIFHNNEVMDKIKEKKNSKN
jgi:hypothetical protein